jgi:outer membrane protein OmpA-like peptidoglycan-associated protein
VAGEKLGEFPSQWDLISGSAEVLTMGGEKAIGISGQSNIAPLMKNMKSYLPDVYTLEMDVYNFEHKRITGGNDWYVFDFIGGSNDRSVFYFTFTPGHDDTFFSLRWAWHPPGSEEQRSGEARVNKPCGKFIHMALSFNQRALKIYFDGERIINVPNCAKASYFNLSTYGNSEGVYFIKNIRMAEGAVPLYDRLMSDGKIVTYGITFDVGKATIRPESMSEINRIAALMKENADIKFSVEGHTDSTGTAAGNQALSEVRSKAVMDKLIEMGIAADHLKAAGKGQNSPIADNKTDEGRAKNRRVEFVKI